MSSPIKQRIIGALILVAVLAIFIPLFLSSHSDTPNMKTRPPSPPPMPVINLKLPSQEMQKSSEMTQEHIPVMTTSTHKNTTALKQTAHAPTAPVKDAKPMINNWRLKLGTFSLKKHSDRLADSLKKQGFEAYVQTKTIDKNKTVYQVFIGPAVSEVEAVQLQKHLLHQLGMPSIIVAYPTQKP